MKSMNSENISFTEGAEIQKGSGRLGYKGTRSDRIFFTAAVIIMFMISAVAGI